MIQFIIVGSCVLAALWFIGRKIYNTMRTGGGCSCDCGKCNSGAQNAASCGCCQHKHLREFRPK